MRETRRRRPDVVPLAVGIATSAAAGLAMWRSPVPWTFTLDSGSVFLGQTLPAFRAWFAGRVPAWSDVLWGGFPLFGDCTSAALYPLHVLPYLATRAAPLRFFDVSFALHLGIFAAGSAALLRKLGASVPAAVLAAVLAAFAPFAHVSAIGAFQVFACHAWWPWVFLAVETLTRPGTPVLGGAMALGWIAVAFQVLAGVPEQAAYSAVPAAIWLLARRSSLPVGQRIARAAVFALGATALAAPQLFPTAALLAWTQRAGTPHAYQFGSMWLTNPERLFVAGTGVLNGLPSFLGIATVLAALVAVAARRPGAGMLIGTATVGFAVALGPQVGLYDLLHRVPPFDHFRNPGKAYALTEYTTLWLAALGVDALWRRPTAVARVAAVLLVAAVIVERAVYFPLELRALAAMRAGDGLTPARYDRLASLVRLHRRDERTPPPVVFDHGGPLGGGYARSVGALVGISVIHAGSVALLSPAHLALLDRPTAPMLDVFGVRYVLAPIELCPLVERRLPWTAVERSDDDCIFENPMPSDRYVFLDDVVAVDSADEMVDLARRRPRPIPIVAPPDAARLRGRGALQVTSYEPGHATLQATATAPALVLVRDSFAPGWIARVDGRPVAPYPAAGIFFAVPVPTGTHTIALDYHAPGFIAGLLVAAGWTLVAATLASMRRRAQARAA
jgi:hypothetical protein